jgi:hypothetical protein
VVLSYWRDAVVKSLSDCLLHPTDDDLTSVLASQGQHAMIFGERQKATTRFGATNAIYELIRCPNPQIAAVGFSPAFAVVATALCPRSSSASRFTAGT